MNVNASLIDQGSNNVPHLQRISTVHRQLLLLRTQEDRHLIYRGDEAHTVLRYLQRCIAAHPRQLRNHIRRIYLAIGYGKADQLWGALIDLALVLRGRGKRLMNRILDQSAPLLSPDQVTAYRQAYATCDMDRLNALAQSESILASGLLPLKAFNQ